MLWKANVQAERRARVVLRVAEAPDLALRMADAANAETAGLA